MWRDRSVVHVVSSGSIGGAENQVVCWAAEQVRRGAGAVWYLGLDEVDGGVSVHDRCSAAGVHYESLRSRRHPVHAWRRAGEIVQRLRPDYMHCHLPRAIGFGSLVSQSGRRPIRLASFHNIDPKLPRVLWSLLFRACLRRYDGISGISGAVAEFVACATGLPRSRIGVTPYGLERTGRRLGRERARAALGCQDRAPILLSIGRLAKQKNQAEVVRLVHALRGAYPRILGLIVGRDEGEGPRLRALSAELGVQAEVRIDGFTENPRTYFEAADLFVFPSAWEGLGLVLLEAMDVGLPIVAYRTAAVAETVGQGEAGVLVALNDFGGLVRASEQLLGSAAASETLVARAWSWLEREFSPTASFERLEAWLGRVTSIS